MQELLDGHGQALVRMLDDPPGPVPHSVTFQTTRDRITGVPARVQTFDAPSVGRLEFGRLVYVDSDLMIVGSDRFKPQTDGPAVPLDRSAP